MKNLLVILSTCLVLISCQQTVDVEKETAAIEVLIQKSADAWTDRDYDSMQEVWLQDNMATRIGANANSYGITEGWEDMDARYKNFFEDYPEPSPSKEIFMNHRMRIYPQVAYTTVDRYLLTEEGDTTEKALHTYILVKSVGEWKIATLSSVVCWSYDIGEQNLAVSETYHELNPEDIDQIFTDDFSGHDEIGGSWTREGHKNFLTNNKGNMSDSIMYQMANGNMVATMFQRKGDINGEEMTGEALMVKRFEDGKIAEIREYGFGVFKQ